MLVHPITDDGCPTNQVKGVSDHLCLHKVTIFLFITGNQFVEKHYETTSIPCSSNLLPAHLALITPALIHHHYDCQMVIFYSPHSSHIYWHSQPIKEEISALQSHLFTNQYRATECYDVIIIYFDAPIFPDLDKDSTLHLPFKKIRYSFIYQQVGSMPKKTCFLNLL